METAPASPIQPAPVQLPPWALLAIVGDGPGPAGRALAASPVLRVAAALAIEGRPALILAAMQLPPSPSAL